MKAFNSISCHPICFSDGIGKSGAGSEALAACCFCIFGPHEASDRKTSTVRTVIGSFIIRFIECHEGTKALRYTKYFLVLLCALVTLWLKRFQTLNATS